MRFLLDTDTCIYAMKQEPVVVKRILSHRRPDLAISVVTEAELRYGIAKSNAPAHNGRVLDAFLMPFEILDFTSAETTTYGELRDNFERAGTPTGSLDILLAAQAKARNLVLVTNNVREFRRVPGLKVENWRT